MTKGFMIAALRSGGGKTTATMALLSGLLKRKNRPAALKVGPDYIDPMFHRRVLSIPTHNMDLAMMGLEGVKEKLTQAARECDTLVVEGVMGLYDGKGHGLDNGSTAHLARLLRLPVVFLADPTGMGPSFMALIKGFLAYDPRVPLAGILLTKVKERSVPYYRRMIEEELGLPYLGYLPQMDDVTLPSRHLGLVTPDEQAHLDEVVHRLGETALATVDFDRLLQRAALLTPASPLKTTPPENKGPIVALAKDAAFSFVYSDVENWFEDRGYQVIPFSPLKDPCLPQGTKALYLPGGYPELHLEELAKNTSLLMEIKAFVESGSPCYAECGGLMYLAQSIEDMPMVGALPLFVTMTDGLQDFGYRKVRWEDAEATGHSFHHSIAKPTGPIHTWAEVHHPTKGWIPSGYQVNKTYASYIHLHFSSATEILERIFPPVHP